ncbi:MULTISPECIES: [NiFe]-hydrogenase assembly chaperone HybE [unclassified Mesorhizobium]|uniref:[NiFe]-hydrogenase assembly chaperone HybE n=1 Tax=unclassified Mesorhizobium TaxID=325217 RepID=UPI000FCCCAA8|nr:MULTISPECIES: [NiFe]-hydrogenase assembly chaperone HybE [unclassified Mesorhizobium]RUW34607.1 [NiFe]-hydrogenase assembly, chaperone, HybE [Mesorhizobium sp. M1E.F.Ca.ET.041.01.1.1]RWD90876.1 MAG: [NiFe]-hydrogenase assembly, chaperone, HybE [Mesorhizobium sp.]RWD92173.1 MAG: [NiFe]-hydrogenase assembly, chaperone, HybE [Mesorhizobium sp.]
MDQSLAVVRCLESVFQRVERTSMEGIPILNPALSVRALGVRMWQGEWLAVLITPWFMNLVLLPAAGVEARTRLRPGAKEQVAFPAGRFEFIHAHEEELGAYLACSLFSPVFEFADQESAEETARQVLAELFRGEAEDDEDVDMVRLWEGRLPDPDAAPDEDAAPVTAKPLPLTRRALFGLHDEDAQQ